MNYNSWQFWLLFALVFVRYWQISHRAQNTLLLVASYLFYGFWDYRFLFLILISTIIDFIGGLGVAGVQLRRRQLCNLGMLIVGSSLILCSNIRYRELSEALWQGNPEAAWHCLPTTWADFRIPLAALTVTIGYAAILPWLYALPEQRRRNTFLAISMVANLAILGFFKYCDFFIVNFRNLLDSAGVEVSLDTLGIILPAGISFYTFQAMSYTIDIYRRETEPTDHFPDFALFVCFFPHLVAGPIMRAHTLLPQVLQPRVLTSSAVHEGVFLVLIGMFKKLVLADNLAPFTLTIFGKFASSSSADLSGLDVLVGVYAFAFQIYGDFSGYSSVARGISKWLGYELSINFHNPYLAVSPSDFWRRWHISLSSWLRDYLYVPLGGNRGGTLATYRNLLLTMLLGGLWHGANWTFVAWGAYHGFILCLFRLLGWRDPKNVGNIFNRCRWVFSVILMFHLTCIGWLLFRADSISSAWLMMLRAATDWHVTAMTLAGLCYLTFFALPMFVWESIWDGENRLNDWTRYPWLAQALLLAYLLVMLLVFSSEKAYEFIYFQF